MLTPLFILSIVVLICAGLSVYWSVRSYRRYKLNLLLTEELSSIIASAKKTIEEAHNSLGEDLMQSPQMLSTIVAVFVHKYGDVRLSTKDFMISDDTYVSVYVDTTTQEIILSLNHDLISEQEELRDSLLAFGKNVDNTFH
tara:strand:+ start:404 stop:826 length:423 start_codon:yes stop_codon:yes gene_type:complete